MNKSKFTNLKEIREYKKFTQKYVAKKAEISESYYNLIENGKRRVPITIANKISETLDITLDDFFILYNFTNCEVSTNVI